MLNTIHQKLAYFLAKYGGDIGDRILHRLGWYAFRMQEFRKAHAEGCSGGPVATLMRQGGYFKRCESCNVTVLVHFAFWETTEGKVPVEVMRWLAEALR